MRPTGKLHLGHFHGVLSSWLELQDDHECFFFAADWHALTTEYANPGFVRESIDDLFLDWLSVGIDPEKCVMFRQSAILEHAELHLLLSMLTPVPWLERNPTYKDQLEELKEKELNTYGFLGYPILQAADIVIYKANAVPIGLDQLPHLELTREIARRFNFIYRKDIVPEPDAMLTKTSKLLGTDGRKMSKSYGNAIYLSDSRDEVKQKLSTMFTDPQRLRRTDPGDPDVCAIFTMHKLYSPAGEVEEIDRECRKAGIGCVDCKKRLIGRLNDALEPIREKRAGYAADQKRVKQIVSDATERARGIAKRTMAEVREAVGI
jgi:tryptophanyl-tRNA synthetase